MSLSPTALKIYEELLANQEGVTSTRQDGSRWASVYLDNARPDNVTPRQFAGYLRALEGAGLYRSQEDNFFGDVRLPPE